MRACEFGQAERRSVFWIVIVGHGAPPLTRCVVASPGASSVPARRGVIVVRPRPGRREALRSTRK